MPVVFRNAARSTLNGAITNVATSAVVAAGEGARFSADSVAVIMDAAAETNWELVKITAVATDTLTITREFEDATRFPKVAHASGSRIVQVLSAWTMENQPPAVLAFARGGTVLSPVSGTTVMVWRAPFACTVTNVRSHFKGGTSVVVNARKNQASNHLASNHTNSTADAWGDGGATQNTAYAAGDDLEIMLVTVNGAVTEAAIQVDLTRP